MAAIRRSAGPQAAAMVREMVSATFGKPHQGLIATIAGWAFRPGAGLVFGGLIALVGIALITLLALLLWIYYSSMSLLFGAEFTRLYAERHGTRGALGAAPGAPAHQPRPRPRLERLNAAKDRE